MYDARLNLSRQVATEAREYFGAKVFETVVPRNVRLAEAPSFGKPIILYDVASVGAQAYMNVAKELLRRKQMSAEKPRRLGRGLEALDSSCHRPEQTPTASDLQRISISRDPPESVPATTRLRLQPSWPNSRRRSRRADCCSR